MDKGQVWLIVMDDVSEHAVLLDDSLFTRNLVALVPLISFKIGGVYVC